MARYLLLESSGSAFLLESGGELLLEGGVRTSIHAFMDTNKPTEPRYIHYQDVGSITGYVEYLGPTSGSPFLGELLAYVEYTGGSSGSYVQNIPSLGELLGYVEYTYLTDTKQVGDVCGYVEYTQTINTKQTAELLAYVEYTGGSSGSYIQDIPSLGELLGYIEYEQFDDVVYTSKQSALIWGAVYNDRYSKHAFIAGQVRTWQHAFMEGIPSRTSTHALIWGGSVKQVDNIHAYVRGKDFGTTIKNAYLIGMPKTIISAYIRGASLPRATNVGLSIESAPAFKQRVTSATAQIETSSTHKQKLTSIIIQVEYKVEQKTAQSAYICGVSQFEIEWAQVKLPQYTSYYALGSISAFIRGGIQASTTKYAYMRGWFTDSTSIHAYLSVGVGTLDSKPAYIRGWAHGSTIQHACLNSNQPASVTSIHAYMWAQPGTRQPAYIHGGGTVRVTTVGSEVEWRYPATKRITSAGSALEWRYPYWLRVTAAGLTIEWVQGSTVIFKVTSVGVMIEWTALEDLYGPLLWMIG
ncbi:hypothetical protein MUP59_02665 [Candidatus Bathyarchaeota archaeon]|nr:hypothetical protein [Candidatus Bathyarchaeota archaeon]